MYNPNMISVRRNEATRRDKSLSQDLYGILYISARTDTLVHIGSGSESIEYDERIIDLIRKKLQGIPPEKIDYRFIADLSRSIGSKIPRQIVYSHVKYGDKIVIPGTSLKGAARSRLELFFKAHNGSVPSDFVKASPPPPRKAPRGTHGWRHQRIWPTSLENRQGVCDASQAEYWEDIRLCVTCNLFGAPGIRGRVFFGNLESSVKPIIATIIVSRHGREVKASYEFIPKNTVLEGFLGLDGISLVELGLLSIALRLHEDKPILIGRFKYAKRSVEYNGSRVAEWMGRINVSARRLVVPRYADNTRRVLEEAGIVFREEDSIVVEGQELSKLVKLAFEKAREEYGQWFSNIDEIENLEKLDRGELDD